MKYFISFLVSISLLAAAAIPTHAVTSAIANEKKLSDSNTTVVNAGHRKSARTSREAKIQAFAKQSRNSAQGESGAQVRQAPDIALHGSVAPATGCLPSLIAVLHLLIEGDLRFKRVSVPRTHFDRILFRAIISPNAP